MASSGELELFQSGDNKMQIKCHDEKAFADMIAKCVEKGLGFKADTKSLIIELTGAY